jgi:hypothetical protein
MRIQLLFIVVFFSSQLFAQITKGNFLVGGNLSFEYSSHSIEEEGISQLTLKPDGGYFFIDKVAAGLHVDMSLTGNRGDKYVTLMLGPFIRYYFLSEAKKINVLAEADFMFGSEKYSGFSSEGKTAFGLSAGPVFFISPQVGMETLLNWHMLKYANDEGRITRLGLSVGIQVYLRCMRKESGK